MKSTIRAFIAIDISPDVSARARKAIEPLRRAFPDVKWIEEDAFHLTLKFQKVFVRNVKMNPATLPRMLASSGESFITVFMSVRESV